MSLLGNLNTAADAVEDKDSVGGSKFAPWESGLYDLTVAMAFLEVAKSGAIGVNLHLTNDAGQELREKLWIQSGNAKGNKTYYETKDGQKKNLPGFSLFRSLTLMTLNKEPSAVATEEKVIKLWNSSTKSEEATTVPALVDLIGQKIIGGVVKIIENKQVQGANGYVNDPSGATREKNEIDKLFHAGTRMTLAEATGGMTQGEFIDQWEAKWKGQDWNKVEAVTPSPMATQSGAFGAAAAAPAATPQPANSLFTPS